jgi:hypothetical protein
MHMFDPAAMLTAGGRFAWFITENYGSIPAYIEKFDFNASQVYRAIKNKTGPRLETLVLYGLTGLNLHWLATGKGPWWSPDDIGRELARKKGVIFGEVESEPEITSTDYAALIRTVFELVEETVVEKLAHRHAIDRKRALHKSTASKKAPASLRRGK